MRKAQRTQVHIPISFTLYIISFLYMFVNVFYKLFLEKAGQDFNLLRAVCANNIPLLKGYDLLHRTMHLLAFLLIPFPCHITKLLYTPHIVVCSLLHVLHFGADPRSVDTVIGTSTAL